MFARSLGKFFDGFDIWRVGFVFGLKLIVDNMEMTEMAETLDGTG